MPVTFVRLLDDAASWFLSGAGSGSVVLHILEEGRFVLTSPQPPQGAAPASASACSAWLFAAEPSGASRLEFRPDPAAVEGSFDAPEMLAALHELAARFKQARLQVRLPPHGSPR